MTLIYVIQVSLTAIEIFPEFLKVTARMSNYDVISEYF